MPKPSKILYHTAEDFASIEKLTAAQGGAFSHQVSKVTKDGQIYYQKITTDPFVNAIEATAGQLYNLLMPYQPQTLLAKNSQGQNYILSQEVPGYASLQTLAEFKPQELKNSMNNGNYKGLGSVLTASYFMNEIDSKLRNLGVANVNGKQRIIKIDGDWSLAGLRSPADFKYDAQGNTVNRITTDDIRRLPLFTDYKTWNLLDWVKQGKANINYLHGYQGFRLIDNGLSNDPSFRQEVNEMILKTLLMPMNLVNEIASRNSPSEEIYSNITNELASRQNQMLIAALQNISFKNFLNTPAASACLAQTIQDFENFQANNQLPITPLSEMMTQNYQALRGRTHIEYLEKQYENLSKTLIRTQDANIADQLLTIAKTLDEKTNHNPLWVIAVEDMKDIIDDFKIAANQKRLAEIERTIPPLEVKLNLLQNNPIQPKPREVYAVLYSMQQQLVNAADVAINLGDNAKKTELLNKAQGIGIKMQNLYKFLPLDTAKAQLAAAEKALQIALQKPKLEEKNINEVIKQAKIAGEKALEVVKQITEYNKQMKGQEGYKVEDPQGYKTLAKHYESLAESSEKPKPNVGRRT